MTVHDKSLTTAPHSAKVIKGGKIVIPAELRRQFGFKDGDDLVLERVGNGIGIKSYEQVLREIQGEFRAMLGKRKASIVDELLAERRAEAARE